MIIIKHLGLRRAATMVFPRERRAKLLRWAKADQDCLWRKGGGCARSRRIEVENNPPAVDDNKLRGTGGGGFTAVMPKTLHQLGLCTPSNRKTPSPERSALPCEYAAARPNALYRALAARALLR